MSDQSTRAREPEADPRQRFTLTQAEAEQLQKLGLDAQLQPAGVDALNAYWGELGAAHAFVWTTVADLEWIAPPAAPGELHDVEGATFTAWPILAS